MSHQPLKLFKVPPPRIDADQVRPILAQLIDSLADAMVVVDRSRRVVAANRRYLEAFGASGTDLTGSFCQDTLNCPALDAADGSAPATDGRPRCEACAAIERRQPFRQMRTVTNSDGVTRGWEATFSPVVGPDGEVTHVVEVWRDVSERSQLEAQLAHSERLASLGMLAAGVAHEINNPVASILAGVERLARWLRRTTGIDETRRAEASRVIEGLEAEVLRCRETTEKLMLLAQPYRSTPTWVDVNRAVRDTLALLNHQMGRQGVKGVEDLEPDLPRILGREGGVRGVCMNLAINALQAMPHGGTLTLRTRRAGDKVRIEVEDTGTGIDPAHLERIWDPFFTTKPVGQGTGLGLSISRQVIHRHHGTIRVESQPGRGARFVIEIPIEVPGGPLV
ncbi:MAG TPA: ATP-binding protein [Candidatus Eisenbacteria bacterium]